MGLVRWLYDSGWPPERLQVRPTRARYVIPDYPDRRYELPEAQAEREFLEKTFGATAVEPQPTPVRKLISTRGAFDLLHFAGHGAAETDAITEARLLLQGRVEDGRYIEAPFTTTTVNTRSNLTGADGSRPLVVLNACQTGRLGYALTGIGGFAQAFLNGGAGAFIGTQWSVGDVPGRVFTETFYRQLLDGATVAEATTESRERARADGDATWLAYAVYAHPHARLVRSGAP
jgi:CHAT domain-containing protein